MSKMPDDRIKPTSQKRDMSSKKKKGSKVSPEDLLKDSPEGEVSPEGAEEQEEIFAVEKILDKKIVNGKIQYFLKWQNYPDSENSWEPVENLNCTEIIEEYERQASLKKKNEDDKKRKSVNGSEAAQKKKRSSSESGTPNARGFDRNLKPERIIGATTDQHGNVMFLMKWEKSDEADLVESKLANEKCPQIVIQFYEERLTWHTGNNQDDDKEKDENAPEDS